MVLVSAAVADTWGALDDGFVSPARDDAPVDGLLVYASNYVPEVTVIDGPGAPFALEATLLTGVGAPPRTALWPPSGGWEPGATYTVSVSSYDSGTTTERTFTASDAPAPAADVLEVHDVSVDDWSEEMEYPWGCCLPTRRVQIDVEVPGADPWAYVEVVGQFDVERGSQITAPPNTHLDLALGAGPHVLGFTQWLDDDVPQPPCFEVVAVSAAGVAGASEGFCTDGRGRVRTMGGTPGGCGCDHGGAWPVAVAPFLLLVYRRREGRDELSR